MGAGKSCHDAPEGTPHHLTFGECSPSLTYMVLHTDIPARNQIDSMMTARNPASVSIYLPTDPVSTGEHERLQLKNLTTQAARDLAEQGVDKRDIAAIEDELQDLIDDVDIWRYMARSLAIFATPDYIATFRLPNHLNEHLHVSDRFFLKPLLRSVTFPHMGYVLALSQNQVRLLEVLPEGAPFEVSVPDLPSDMGAVIAAEGAPGRAPRRRLAGAEGTKVRMAQFARRINQALRPVLQGDAPLVIAGTEPMVSIFRAACTYPDLSPDTLSSNPETTPDADLAQQARAVLDRTYAQQLAAQLELFEQRRAQSRAVSDLADVAKAATRGMVDTVFVDIDDNVPGQLDDDTGEVTFADDNDPHAYGLVDEIVRQVWMAGGQVLAVRREDVPDQGTVAAILRYPLV